MAKLSINLNKFALVRNARGNNQPNLLAIAKQCLDLGAAGITVHPRPDQRHVKYDDLFPLHDLLKQYPGSEFNIEGYPSIEFLQLIKEIRPDQVTLVPDPPEALTSSFGWDLRESFATLAEILSELNELKIRVSLFVDPDLQKIANIADLKPNRAELYTYDYAHYFSQDSQKAIAPYISTAQFLTSKNIALNAGHDLNLKNLTYLLTMIPDIQEVSIGHAFVCDCWQYGLSKTMQLYLSACETAALQFS